MTVIIVTLVLIMLIGIPYAFILGTDRPSTKVKERLATEAILTHFANWYNRQIWTCVKKNKNGVGFMGTTATNILVESNTGERVLIYGHNWITVGDQLRSRPASDDEMNNGVWVSPTDRYVTFEKIQ